jgi:signal transduction histidine kinase
LLTARSSRPSYARPSYRPYQEALGATKPPQQYRDALVENAVAHTSEGNEITLSARLDGGVVLIEVADTGTGFDPEILPVAFDRFAREKRVNGSRRGTGLGLAIVKTIVESHGGTVSISSEAGAGTTVSIRLGATAPIGLQGAQEALAVA